MNKWISTSLAILLAGAFAAPARADLFDQILGGGSKKKAQVQTEAVARKFKFVIHLTTGDVLKAVEYKGGGSSKKGSFRFISNFESDIEIRTPFLKYIDMDMVGDQVLEEEYLSSKQDRVYLKNQDYLTGKVVGFTAKDVMVATTYGDLKASVGQIRYVMFRNPAASADVSSKAPSSMPAASPAPPAPSSPEGEK